MVSSLDVIKRSCSHRLKNVIRGGMCVFHETYHKKFFFQYLSGIHLRGYLREGKKILTLLKFRECMKSKRLICTRKETGYCCVCAKSLYHDTHYFAHFSSYAPIIFCQRFLGFFHIILCLYFFSLFRENAITSFLLTEKMGFGKHTNAICVQVRYERKEQDILPVIILTETAL